MPLSCRVQSDRWLAPHLAVRAHFDCGRWTCRAAQPVQRTPLWLASWLPAVDKSRGSISVEVHRVWEVYHERLLFMSRHDAIQLDESLDADEVSRAWLVWSGAAESALADAYQFCGGPIPNRGLVLGWGRPLFRVVRLGGHQVRKARGNAADAHDAADVFLYRDPSGAPLLDVRRRFKAVMDVLDAMIRPGASLSLSVELTAQWDEILAVGPLFPVALDDFHAVDGSGLGDIFIVLLVVFIAGSVTSFMGLSFIVGMKPFGGGVIGCGRTSLFIPASGFVQIWFPLLHFLSVSPILLLVVLECLLTLPGLMRNSERPGFPTFVALGKGTPAFRNSMRRLEGGYHFYRRSPCPG